MANLAKLRSRSYENDVLVGISADPAVHRKEAALVCFVYIRETRNKHQARSKSKHLQHIL